MNKEAIRIEDLRRILLGQAPPEFLLETFLRTLLVFAVLLVAVSYLGKRMKGELTITEMAVMVMLGAIISAPMQVPDRGLLQGIWVLGIVVLLQRALAWLGVRSKKVELWTQGRMCLLVKDGVLQLDNMRKAKLTHQEVFALLRTRDIHQLGKVDRLYLESCGTVSIFTGDDDRPGLSVLPSFDEELLRGRAVAGASTAACTHCGATSSSALAPCDSCGRQAWTGAIL